MTDETMKDGERVVIPLAWQDTFDGLLAYVLQDDLHNRLTPRVIDIAYTAFMSGACGKNEEDGGRCDWFNDTKPVVEAAIEEIRKELAEARAATPQSGKSAQFNERGIRCIQADSLRAAAPQAALTNEQRYAIEWAADRFAQDAIREANPIDQHDFRQMAETLRALLLQAPTERMSDAAREGYSDYQDGMERENNPFLEPHSVGFQEWEKGWNAARKAEIEHGEGQS